MSGIRIITALMALLFVIFTSGSLAAWEQTINPDTGQGISWNTSCFHYSINDRGYSQMAIEDIREITRRAFDTWENVPCSFFYFIETETVSVDKKEFNKSGGNVNLIVWRETPEDWEYSMGVIGLTTVIFNNKTNEILDADIEMNAAWNEFGVLTEEDADSPLVDLESTLTHEIGHTIGLDHPEDMPDVTMAPNSNTGEINKRTLEADDIEGICSLYPLDQDPGVCQEPYCGFDPSGDADCITGSTNNDGSCSMATSSRHSFSFFQILSIVLFD